MARLRIDKLLDNLRFRLILLVLLGVVPALIVTYLSGMEQRRLATRGAQEDAYRYTRQISTYEASLNSSTQRILKYIAKDPDLLDPRACQTLILSLHQIYSIYTSVSVADRDGNVYCSSYGNAGFINISGQSSFQLAVQQKTISMGEITQGSISGKIILPFSMPILDANGNIEAVITAGLDLDQVLSYAQSLDLPPQSSMLLIDERGTVLLRYPGAEIWSGRNLPDVPIVHEVITKQSEGTAEVSGVDGVKRMYAFTPLQSAPGHAAFVAIGIPSEIIYANTNQILRTNLTWIGLTALLALATAWFAGDLLFLRVVSLTKARDAAEAQLRATNAELETRVQQRTAELSMANEQLGQELLKRQQLVDILRRREAELKRLLRDLEISNRDLQEFAYISSHDLQEPLRKIQAYSDRLGKSLAPQLSEVERDQFERMAASAKRMQKLIDDLLAYSRIITRGQEFRPVDLNRVLQEVLSDLEIRLKETRGRVQAENLPVIEADPIQIRQLLQNLISNGLKFHRPKVPPEIQISCEMVSPEPEQNGSRVVITVADNGIGFDEKYLDRIFKPFQRLHGRDKYEGTGIGLAICQRVAERHHGELTATSVVNQGSRFIITLPVKQPAQQKGT